MSRAQTRRGWQAHFRGERPRPWGAKAHTGIQRSEGRTSPRHIVPGHDPLVLARYPAVKPGLEGWIARLDAEPRA